MIPEPLELWCSSCLHAINFPCHPWTVPLIAAPAVTIDGWSTTAHVLLLEAKKVAGRSYELVGQVRAMAAELVGSGELDPDDAFAEELGLPRT